MFWVDSRTLLGVSRVLMVASALLGGCSCVLGSCKDADGFYNIVS